MFDDGGSLVLSDVYVNISTVSIAFTDVVSASHRLMIAVASCVLSCFCK